ncbi:hypothetical protein CKO28_10800 [Rhodovibrio sodomensis]|uniref:GNAT family N-acetyltransferase n=1 Tax=Rhodovibrio sodomensis TaxID=1088 RepID=A0ABS1DDM6_9PROT|nr:hypothetical protein [Rhodovibrio sodomensis]
MVEAVRPDISLDAWLTHIDRVLAGARTHGAVAGAIVLTAGDRYVYGAFTYSPWTTLALGRTLMVDDFCALGLAGERAPVKALFDAADRLAVQQSCQSVCVKFLDGDRTERAWHTHPDAAAYFPIPALAKRID